MPTTPKASNDTKETKRIVCESCDSEFTLSYIPNLTNGLPAHCPFCGDTLADDEEHESYLDPDDEEADEDY